MPKIPNSDVTVLTGDCRKVLPTLPPDSFDSVVTDPPYELGFMGKKWDSSGVAFDPNTWRAVLRVLKPGGYMLVMGGSRTYHRLACAVEDAGFEIRDCLMWLHSMGFPKAKSCLKPAHEPILLCRKPGGKMLELQIDECRVPTTDTYSYNADCNGTTFHGKQGERIKQTAAKKGAATIESNPLGRWPANVVHDGSDEVMKLLGDAARFFYCAKASRAERETGLLYATKNVVGVWEVMKMI